MRLLTRRVWPCAARSRPPRRGALPYLCSLPAEHRGDHEARLLGRTVHRWPQRSDR